jgi:iron complex outermembrane receptor protein
VAFVIALEKIMLPTRIIGLAAILAAGFPAAIRAQPAAPNLSPDSLPTVVVTANPLGSELFDLVSPTSVLDGQQLMLRQASTLGETLSREPGVSSSYFGPNASRPVIRGMDEDRIRILQDGVGMADASSLSPDHATTVDPLVMERVEVVRGPAALLYGGSAIGGVVNVLDNRIPQQAIDGMRGRFELRAGGADDGHSGAVVMEGGNGSIALHADAESRHSDDLRIPGFTRSDRQRRIDDPDQEQPRSRLPNSAAEGAGGALGASLTLDHGYVGASVADFNTQYGTVAEPQVRIDMHSRNGNIAGELRDLDGFIQDIRFKFGNTDYSHQEIDAGVVGTTFTNKGNELRLEATHSELGPFKGAFGLQLGRTDFSALGDEAMVPQVTTDSSAVFAFEEAALGSFKLNVGGRLERTRLDSAGGGPADPGSGLPRFGNAREVAYSTRSGAFGGIWAMALAWSLAANLSHTERAPTFSELFAHGPHPATGQYVVGNAGLDRERSNGLDLQLRWRSGTDSVSIGVFATRFSSYISTGSTGNTRGGDGELNPADGDGDGIADGSGAEILPEAATRQVAAEFSGFEAQGRFRLLDSAGQTLELSLRGDYVRARNRDTGEPLPRIPPLRLGAGLDWQLGAWAASADLTRVSRQGRIAANELPTDAYTLADLALTRRIDFKPVVLEAFVKVNNLLNHEARVHSSVLKDIAPLPGRA